MKYFQFFFLIFFKFHQQLLINLIYRIDLHLFKKQILIQHKFVLFLIHYDI